MNKEHLHLFALATVLGAALLLFFFHRTDDRVTRRKFHFPNDIPSSRLENKLMIRTTRAKQLVIEYIRDTTPFHTYHSSAINLLPCFDHVTFYYSTHHKPTQKHIAFVKRSIMFPAWQAWQAQTRKAREIFINAKWFLVNKNIQTETIIHECAHISLHAEDYAYVWEHVKYNHLSVSQSLHNAASIAREITHYNNIFDLYL